MAESNIEYELSTHASIRDVGEAEYRALVKDETPPFLRFEWLDALEQSGCATAETGWLPMFVVLRRGGKTVAVAPAYVKGHSDGEFVFDHAWARFAESSLGIPYYPKLVLAVPFTPATGPKLLVASGEDPIRAHAALCQGLGRVTEVLELSSAHVLFPPPEEALLLEKAGLSIRYGVQYHWTNPGYETFDDFLARFRSKRRAAVRRERREMARQNIDLVIHTGSELRGGLVDLAYSFYLSTVDKYVWGRRYLNREFFQRVCETMGEQIHLVVAYERATKKPLGGAFNLLGKDALYGRYWGCLEERPFLHFNVCFYAGIEDCIARGLERFEPGAGGEHKQARGFEPTITRSAHLALDPRLSSAVGDFLAREREAVSEYVASYRADPVLRPLDAC